MKIGESILSKTIVIFDGDTLAYRASAAIEKRTIKVKHEPTGKHKIFKTRTEFKEHMKAQEKEITPEYTIEDIQESEPIENCLHILKSQVKNITEALFADEYLVCLSGRQNFRDTLPLPSKYKGARGGLMRPVHLREAKGYLYKNHPSLLADNREADDDLIVKGYEYLNRGYTVILAGCDKDSYSASGLNLYDFTKDQPQVELVPYGVGYLKDTGKKITGRGFMWLMYQWVLGDSTDNFCPYELANVRFGAKSAFKILKDCTTEIQLINAVVQQFKAWYPEPFEYTAWNGEIIQGSYKQQLQLYLKCCRMMQHENDTLDLREFLALYGVELPQ